MCSKRHYQSPTSLSHVLPCRIALLVILVITVTGPVIDGTSLSTYPIVLPPALASTCSAAGSYCRPHVVSGSSTTTISPGPIAWYKNDGNGNFTTMSVGTKLFVTGVFSADLDGDGSMDVLSTSTSDATVAWFANGGTGSFTPRPDLSAGALGVQSIFAADFDSDGDMDVVTCDIFNLGGVTWYSNSGTGSFTVQPPIDSSAGYPQSVFAADLDDDGNIDVLIASVTGGGLPNVVWYRNNGTSFTVMPAISTTAPGAHSVFAVCVLYVLIPEGLHHPPPHKQHTHQQKHKHKQKSWTIIVYTD